MVNRGNHMNTRKYAILGIIFAAIVSGIFFLDFNKKQEVLVKPAADYLNDKDLLDKSQTIVEVSNSQKDRDIKYLNTDFVLFQVNVVDVIRGEDTLINQPIKILQTVTNSSRYPLLEANKKYVLFLDQYEGPIVSDAYVICGMSLGMLEEQNDKVVLSEMQQEYFSVFNKYELTSRSFKNQLSLYELEATNE